MSDLTDRLAGLGATELAAFFGGTDAGEITDLIRGTSDAELSALLADDTFREQGVTAILTRFGEFADPDRLAAVKGVVTFELRRERGAVERHVARFDGGQVTLEDPSTPPDVTIAAPDLGFVRLVTGQRNAALLYLADELGVDGDGLLALDVGSVFRLPGSGETVVDPRALDPVDVATAVKGVSREHLAEVMGGQFRELVVGEVFRRLPDFIDLGKARHLRLAIGFRVAGRADGGADRYVVEVADGVCTVAPDPDSQLRRDATLMLDGPDFVRLVTGHLNPVRALLAGQLKLKGDRAKALAFNAVMNPPRAR